MIVRNRWRFMEEYQSDGAVLSEIGQRLARQRIRLNLTQEKLAEEAGVSKRTVERIERGNSAQLLSIVRVMRELGLLGGLYHALPTPGPGPIELLQGAGRPRRRASSARQAPAKPWVWGDDS